MGARSAPLMAELDKPTGRAETTTGAHAEPKNQKTMMDLFSPPSQRGRRAKAAETRGRKAEVSQSLPAPKNGKGPAVVLPPAPQAAAPAKLTRTNWSKGENLAKFTLAVEEWEIGSGRAAPREHLGDPEPRKPSLGEFAALVEIPKGALANYATSAEGRARSLGASSGQQSHLSNDDRLFVNFRCGRPSSSGLRQRRHDKAEGNGNRAGYQANSFSQPGRERAALRTA